MKSQNDYPQIEEDFVDMKSDYVAIPSEFSLNETKLEVSLVFSVFVVLVCDCGCFSVVQVILMCHQIQRTPLVIYLTLNIRDIELITLVHGQIKLSFKSM
jgi:hypothetical protein